MTVTRFAPSPNGPLHWGHAYSAIVAHDLARAAGGRFLLRIEDIDGPRSRPELAEEFRKDLAWLGLEWDEVPAQGTRLARYEEALDELDALGVLYPRRNRGCGERDGAGGADLSRHLQAPRGAARCARRAAHGPEQGAGDHRPALLA